MSAEDYGMKVSLPGYDVKTATPEQCAVHSSYPPFKAKTNQNPPHFATLVVDFTATITQNLTQTVYSFSHEYSYTPATFPNIIFDDGAGTVVTGIGFTGVGANLSIFAYANATDFLVTIYDNFNYTSNSATLTVSYYIFAENGA